MNAYRILHRIGFRALLVRPLAAALRSPLATFPQGTPKPERQNGWHRGAARLALATGAPALPVGRTRTRPLPRRTQHPHRRRRTDLGSPCPPTIAAARAPTERLEQAVTAK